MMLNKNFNFGRLDKIELLAIASHLPFTAVAMHKINANIISQQASVKNFAVLKF